jgi:hypothetical protein
VNISALEVSVRGVRPPVLSAAPPDGAEATVFVHGNPGPSDARRALLTRAGELGRAIAPDMPGYGHAGTPKDFSYTADGYAAHLAACSISPASPARISSRTTSEPRGHWPGPRAIPTPWPAPRSSTPAC